jgi:hypothetical protein
MTNALMKVNSMLPYMLRSPTLTSERLLIDWFGADAAQPLCTGGYFDTCRLTSERELGCPIPDNPRSAKEQRVMW